MLQIGIKISELRKQQKWSQSDLAKAVNDSRDITGRYTHNENASLIEMAQKITDVFRITVDYLLGKNAFLKCNQRILIAGKIRRSLIPTQNQSSIS